MLLHSCLQVCVCLIYLLLVYITAAHQSHWGGGGGGGLAQGKHCCSLPFSNGQAHMHRARLPITQLLNASGTQTLNPPPLPKCC